MKVNAEKYRVAIIDKWDMTNVVWPIRKATQAIDFKSSDNDSEIEENHYTNCWYQFQWEGSMEEGDIPTIFLKIA